MSQYPVTPDGRYFVVRGRLWRCSNPQLPDEERQRLTAELPALLGDRQAVAVFAAMADKDVASMVSLLRTVCPTIIATSSSNPRSLPADTVASLAGGPSCDRPKEALEAARVLAPGGRLLIADFAPHDCEELRTRDAHTRLGFSDEQMTTWFAAAGLAPERIETLEGGELTVKLWLARKRASAEQTVHEVKAA